MKTIQDGFDKVVRFTKRQTDNGLSYFFLLIGFFGGLGSLIAAVFFGDGRALPGSFTGGLFGYVGVVLFTLADTKRSRLYRLALIFIIYPAIIALFVLLATWNLT